MKPYFQTPTATLFLGDCLEVLPQIEGIGAVITDPPYGQTNESYDGPIAFRLDVWRSCLNASAESAALLSFAGSPTYHRIATGIEAGGWRVRQMWGWVYRDGLITSLSRRWTRFASPREARCC